MASPAAGHKRSNPFLRRSWAAAVTNNSAAEDDAEGNSPSKTPNGRPGKKQKRAVDADNDAPDASFKFNRRAPTRVPVSAETSRAMRLARTRPQDSKAEPQSLRINVSEIVHGTLRHGRGAAIPAAARAGQRTKALCTVTILCSHDSQPQTVRHRESQMCSFDVYRSPNSPHRKADIALTRPFIIVRESLLVNRGESLGFADSYELSIEFEAGEGPWPVFGPTDFGINPSQSSPFLAAPRRWVLKGRFVDIFKRPRNFIKVQLLTRAPENHRGTDHYMMVDISWASPASPAPLVSRDGVTDPPASADANGTPHQGLDDGAGPGRSRRGKEPNNNHSPQNGTLQNGSHQGQQLLTASDIQHPADPAPPPVEIPNTTVTYQFPNCAVPLDAYACVACSATHPSVRNLQAHLQVNHEQFEFEMRQVPSRGLVCFIRHRTDDDPTMAIEQIQMFGHGEALDLDGIARGDLSSVREPRPARLEGPAAQDDSSDQLSLPPPSPELEPPSLPAFALPAYGPLVQDVSLIHQRRAHMSWYYQRDMASGPHSRSAPSTQLSRLWDQWFEGRELDAPVSLQVELVRLAKVQLMEKPAFSGVRDALSKQLAFLVEARAIDDAYSSSLADLITESALRMGIRDEGRPGEGNAPTAAPKSPPRLMVKLSTSAVARRKDALQPKKPQVVKKLAAVQKPKALLAGNEVVANGGVDDSAPQAETPPRPRGVTTIRGGKADLKKAIPSPSRTLPQRSSRGINKSYFFDPFAMLDEDDDEEVEEVVRDPPAARAKLASSSSSTAMVIGTPRGKSTPRMAESPLARSTMTLSPVTPAPGTAGAPVKRRPGRPRKYPLPLPQNDVTPATPSAGAGSQWTTASPEATHPRPARALPAPSPPSPQPQSRSQPQPPPPQQQQQATHPLTEAAVATASQQAQHQHQQALAQDSAAGAPPREPRFALADVIQETPVASLLGTDECGDFDRRSLGSWGRGDRDGKP